MVGMIIRAKGNCAANGWACGPKALSSARVGCCCGPRRQSPPPAAHCRCRCVRHPHTGKEIDADMAPLAWVLIHSCTLQGGQGPVGTFAAALQRALGWLTRRPQPVFETELAL